MQKEYVYDLTEVFLASTSKFRMYGIMRVVAEIGRALVQRETPMRYAVFSYAYNGFVEVFPERSGDSDVAFNVPLGISEIRMRQDMSRYNPCQRALIKAAAPVIRQRNRWQWQQSGHSVQPLDMNDKVLISASRPKLISDAIFAQKSHGIALQVIPLLHDLMPLHRHLERKSANFSDKFLMDNQTVVSQADMVLANSEFTKSEILHFAEKGVLPTPKAVTAIPLVHECAQGEGQVQITLPDDPYILTVGSLVGRKNLEVVFDAMLLMLERGQNVPMLVMAGKARSTTLKYLEAERMAPLKDKIMRYSNPEQVDLVALYKGALALVLPSRMEGWGLPAGEALWFGVPALCADVPVFKEVCGDLGLYFDPDAPEELAAHIDRLMTDTVFRDALTERIRNAHSTLRTWDHVTNDLLAALAAEGAPEPQ